MAEPNPAELLEASIRRVWNERDGQRRLEAIGEIYHPDARIHEPERTVTGHAAICDVVAHVLADMPPGFRFEVVGQALGHHGAAIARWRGGPPGETTVTGSDCARILDGKIHEHWFFFDPASSGGAPVLRATNA